MSPPRDREVQVVRNAISEMDSATLRGVVKSAIKEMIDEQVRELGRWSLRTLATLLVGSIVLFILWANGWVHR